MAGLGGKNWTFQEEVTSSDVNGYLADQVVMRFGGTATRDAGFGGSGEPTLAEGMVSYLDDANRLDFYDGSAWKPVSKVLQVVQTVKSDTFSASTAGVSWTSDVTGLTASITPSSASSKILVSLNIHGTSSAASVIYRLRRGSTSIGIGSSVGSRAAASGGVVTGGGNFAMASSSMIFLDEPATTSSTTYAVQLYNYDSSTFTLYVNRTNTDTDNGNHFRPISTLTLFEVGA